MKRLHILRTYFAFIFALTVANPGCLAGQKPGIKSPLPDSPTAPPILFAQQNSVSIAQMATQAPSAGSGGSAAPAAPAVTKDG